MIFLSQFFLQCGFLDYRLWLSELLAPAPSPLALVTHLSSKDTISSCSEAPPPAQRLSPGTYTSEAGGAEMEHRVNLSAHRRGHGSLSRDRQEHSFHSLFMGISKVFSAKIGEMKSLI